MVEAASVQETNLDRQSQLRERAKRLREKREAERLAFVEQKYEQQFRFDITIYIIVFDDWFIGAGLGFGADIIQCLTKVMNELILCHNVPTVKIISISVYESTLKKWNGLITKWCM